MPRALCSPRRCGRRRPETPPHTPTAGAANQGAGPAHVAMPTKPCMVMLRTGVDGGRYQEDGAVWAVVPCGVCVRLSVSHVSDSVYARIGVAERRTL